MSKSLVIVESPAKAKTISKYLGNEYIVKSSVGHIRDLPKGKSKAKRQNSIPKDASPEEKARLKKEQERRRIIRRMGVNPDDGWTANYEIIPDPTGNKINRLRLYINYKLSKFTAQSLSYFLEKNNPSIFVRDDLIHHHHFELDTCNLKKNQEKVVMKEMDKVINMLINKKIKNNISQKDYSNLSKKNWLNWLN